MLRRRFLSIAGLAVSAGASGCIGGVARPPGSVDEYDVPWAVDGFGRFVALADVDDTPNGVPVEFGVSVADPTVTADGTARLLTGVWNTDDSLREIDPPFYKGASKWYGNPGIVLHSLRAPDSPSEDYSPGGCIEHSEASAESQSWTLEKLVFRVEPGDLVFDDLLLVDDPTVDGCVPPGEYRFESTHTVADAEFEWGFTVSVVDPFAG